MADKKVTAMTELTSLADGDLFSTVDVSDTTDAGSGTSKKTLYSTLRDAVTTYIGSFAQTLTNKTITDSTNNVMAKSLKSATTTVDVSAATAPSSGQVLTATSSTAATWQAPTTSSDVSCRVIQNAVTSITSSWVSIAFQTEQFDTSSMHDNSTNNTRITVPSTGKYLIGGGWFGATNAVTGIRVQVNGATIIATSIDGNAGTSLEFNSITTLYNLTANDYVELQGYSGSTQNTSGDAQTYFWAIKVA